MSAGGAEGPSERGPGLCGHGLLPLPCSPLPGLAAAAQLGLRVWAAAGTRSRGMVVSSTLQLTCRPDAPST
jgi:hypothetical protein